MKSILRILFLIVLTIISTNELFSQWVQTHGIDGDIQALAANDSTIFAGTDGLSAYLSTDNGTDWKAIPFAAGLPMPCHARAIAICGTNVLIGGDMDTYLSTDNGISWTDIPYDCLRSVQTFAISGLNIFAGTDGGGVIVSTDDGRSWNPSNTGLTNLNVYALAVNGTSILAGTFNGIFLSTDNGASWSVTSMNSGVISAFCVSANKVFAANPGGGVLLSTDNFQTWMWANTGLWDRDVKSLASGGKTIYAGTGSSGVYSSSDYGGSWNAIGPAYTDVRALAVTDTNLFAGTFGNGVWKRSLSELLVPVELKSFTAQSTENTVELKWSTATETNDKGFEVQRASSESFRNSPRQGNWEKIGFISGNGTSSQPHQYLYIDKSVIAGVYYYRLKQIDYDGNYKYSNETEVNFSIPDKYKLSQNYPNPFNPTTVIRYQLKTAGKTTLRIYNSLGREITTLVNEVQLAGEYKVEWNASGQASGVYLYRLQSNEFIDTKKLILLK